MRAAYITRLGPPDVVEYGELPRPGPGPTDVLVRADAIAVVRGRPRRGRHGRRDGAGAVGFRVGDRVWCNSLGHGGRQGACAEYSVVPVDRLYHLPDGVDPVTAVAALHPAATAHLALFRHGHLRPGETHLVAGGPATWDVQPPSPWTPVPGCS